MGYSTMTHAPCLRPLHRLAEIKPLCRDPIDFSGSNQRRHHDRVRSLVLGRHRSQGRVQFPCSFVYLLDLGHHILQECDGFFAVSLQAPQQCDVLGLSKDVTI